MKKYLTIEKLQESKNIAELLSVDDLYEIGQQCKLGLDIDEDSTASKRKTIDDSMKIAMQKTEIKNTPWERASNVKLPLISKAAINYASRTLPNVILNNRVIKFDLEGNDPDGSRYSAGINITDVMNYQALHESTTFCDDLDQLLHVFSVTGDVFIKSYFDLKEQKMCFELCAPDKVIINMNARGTDTADRISHLFTRASNFVVTQQKRGLYCIPKSMEKKPGQTNKEALDTLLQSLKVQKTNEVKENFEIQLVEQHCWFDLDGDGLAEPYIVVFNKETGDVLRIVNRFKDLMYENNVLVEIKPENYFEHFQFLKSLDGGFYGLGFGDLLLPTNDAMNTIVNQLINAGTLATNQGGIFSKNLNFESGELRFRLNEWVRAGYSGGDDISKSVYQWPTREPSQTLYNLLMFLNNMCNDLTSLTDAMQGKLPAQNVAQGTVDKLVSQSSVVFDAIGIRFKRSLTNLFQRQYDLIKEHLSPKKYKEILNNPNADKKADFNISGVQIKPIADERLSSENDRLSKISIMQTLPTLNRQVADMYTLQTLGFPEQQIGMLLNNPDKGPSPEDQKKMADAQLAQAKVAEISAKATLEAERNQMQIQQLSAQVQWMQQQMLESNARIVKMQGDYEVNKAKVINTTTKIQSDEMRKNDQFEHSKDVDQANTVLAAQKNLNDALKIKTMKELTDVKKDTGAKNEN